jgi:hypothetical protein
VARSPLFFAWIVAVAVACSSPRTAPRTDRGPGSPPPEATPEPPDTSPPPPLAEAGFLDLPPQRGAAAYPARMFYAFRAADDAPRTKPLAVFFNGGPGAPTSAGLMVFGTGPYTVDPKVLGGPPSVVPNPASWTSFANLLYLDERQAGFSYGVRAGGVVSRSSCAFSERADAADFVRALLGFLRAHPSLRKAPIVLVGESYGGARATFMLELFLRYREAAPTVDATLADEIQAHYDAVFPALAGQTIPEAQAAQQLGRQILIEPLVGGSAQRRSQEAMRPADPHPGDGPATGPGDDVRKPVEWLDQIARATLGALSEPSTFAQLVGVAPKDVVGLAGPSRGSAFHSAPTLFEAANADAEAALVAQLGALPKGDRYFSSFGPACVTGPDTVWESNAMANAFLQNLAHVRTFITNARYDGIVYAPAIPNMFAREGWPVAYDDAPRPGVARPGWFRVDVPAAPSGARAGFTATVRFPPYVDSGHMVSLSEPAALAEDARAWLAGAD